MHMTSANLLVPTSFFGSPTQQQDTSLAQSAGSPLSVSVESASQVGSPFGRSAEAGEAGVADTTGVSARGATTAAGKAGDTPPIRQDSESPAVHALEHVSVRSLRIFRW